LPYEPDRKRDLRGRALASQTMLNNGAPYSLPRNPHLTSPVKQLRPIERKGIAILGVKAATDLLVIDVDCLDESSPGRGCFDIELHPPIAIGSPMKISSEKRGIVNGYFDVTDANSVFVDYSNRECSKF
jgi:hypothetical protein